MIDSTPPRAWTSACSGRFGRWWGCGCEPSQLPRTSQGRGINHLGDDVLGLLGSGLLQLLELGRGDVAAVAVTLAVLLPRRLLGAADLAQDSRAAGVEGAAAGHVGR